MWILTPDPELHIVTWVVLKDPIVMTSADILALNNAGGVNNRPVVPLNERSALYKA
jgi:carbonic anhydrase